MSEPTKELSPGAKALVRAVKKFEGAKRTGGVNDFGRFIGCGPGMMSKWLRGASKPSLRWRVVLAAKVGIDIMAWGYERKTAPKRKAA